MITLTSKTLKARILPLGATLAGFWVKGRGRSLVLGYNSAEDYIDDPFYMGTIVGPIANRLRGASLVIDGQTWRLPPNEGRNLLHSGHHGLHAQDWRVTAQDAGSVTLECRMAHGVDGLPGNRRFLARYTLEDSADLTLDLTATTDRLTVCTLAHHPYWTLDDAATVAGHSLQVAAHSFLPVDGDMLPTGEIAAVARSDYDFREPRPVAVNRTLDATLCLTLATAGTPRLAATLTGQSGLTLRIETTEPGLQVYNGSGLAPRSASLLDGQDLCAFAGIALEPQGWPDAPHHAHFPSILLRPVAPYRQTTIYRLSQ
jgi:aldose 1-epimerase